MLDKFEPRSVLSRLVCGARYYLTLCNYLGSDIADTRSGRYLRLPVRALISLRIVRSSLQRIRRTLSCGAYKSSYVIHGRRIGTSSLRKGAFLHAPPVQEPR